MEGVVIHMAANGGGAIVWCEDQGPLALVRREDLLAGVDKPLAVGDFVEFDVLEEGDMRICAGITRNAGRSMPVLPKLLHKEKAARAKRSRLTLVHSADPAPIRFDAAMVCV